MTAAAFVPSNDDLLDWRNRPIIVKPWEPEPLKHEQWPPNYRAVYAWRLRQLEVLKNPVMLESAKAYYSTHRKEFIMHWMDTYNPRKPDDKWTPFVFFWRQAEYIDFLEGCARDGENGLVEKCRDAGATWLSCAWSIACWLFEQDDAIGWGSRKQDLVDKLGDADSIFEKMRLILRRLPDCFLPVGYSPDKHATFMKFINPENGSSITGEAGDNIGRGGRKRVYFKDESAHYERPEKIEAALGDNTNCQIDISSVNGVGNVFHRRRESGIEWFPGFKAANDNKGYVRVFVIDWRDHPEKTQEWYDIKRAKAEREGMLHIFAQEVERNYSAAIVNTIIEGHWISAAIDAHLKIPWCTPERMSSVWSAGFDVADEGMDRNALVKRQGIILRHAREWGERDPGLAARNVMEECREHKGIKIQYDSIGVGSSVKSEYNRLVDDGIVEPGLLQMVPWNAGDAVQMPFERIIPDDDDSMFNKDFFGNMKAQAWWSIRTRFYKTWRAVTQGVFYPVDQLISLDSKCPLLHKMVKEFAQPTRGSSTLLKMIVNKKPEGTMSPNIADAAVMAYFPMPEDYGIAAVGVYGNV